MNRNCMIAALAAITGSGAMSGCAGTKSANNIPQLAQPAIANPATTIRQVSSAGVMADTIAVPGAYTKVTFTVRPGSRCTFPTPKGGKPFTVYADAEGLATLGVTTSDSSPDTDTVQLTCNITASGSGFTAASADSEAVSLTVHKGKGHATSAFPSGPVAVSPPSEGQISQANSALGIDVTTATDDELIAHGLPPRPDSVNARDGYLRWLRAVTSPTHKVYKSGIATNLTHGTVHRSAAAGTRRPQYTTQTYGTYNWAGFYVSANPGTWGRVSAEWFAPTVYQPISGNQYASFWVGLDGGGGINEIIQDGTTSAFYDFNGTQYATYFMWYQLVPNQGNEQFMFAINPGDDSYCQAYYQSGYAGFWCKDVTTGQVGTTSQWFPNYSGNTAEWMVERPGIAGQPAGTYYPLAYFGLAYMSGAWVAFASTGNWINFSTQWPDTYYYMQTPSGSTLASAAEDSSPGVQFNWTGYQ